jgi:hypothetical protein
MTDAKRSDREQTILLSVWAALIGEITPKMRAIYVDWDENTISLYFFVDGEFSEEEKEDMSCIVTEVVAQMPDNMFEEFFERLDYPNPIACPGRCVFKRKEVKDGR